MLTKILFVLKELCISGPAWQRVPASCWFRSNTESACPSGKGGIYL